MKNIVLQPGETDGVMWASFGKVHWMIRRKKICRMIARQFYRQETALKMRNVHKIRGKILAAAVKLHLHPGRLSRYNKKSPFRVGDFSGGNDFLFLFPIPEV